MKITFAKPDFTIVLQTIKDLFSIKAWIKNKWFYHLGAILVIALVFNYLNAFKNIIFFESLIIQSAFYSVFFAIGCEFFQLGYIVLKERRSLTKTEMVASIKDMVATCIFCFVITLILLPFFR